MTKVKYVVLFLSLLMSGFSVSTLCAQQEEQLSSEDMVVVSGGGEGIAYPPLALAARVQAMVIVKVSSMTKAM